MGVVSNAAWCRWAGQPWFVGMGVINATVVWHGVLDRRRPCDGVWWTGMEGHGPVPACGESRQVHHQINGQPSGNFFRLPSP